MDINIDISIIDDDYLLIVKQYNQTYKNKDYYFLKEVKNYENYLKYLNYIFRIKKKLQYYEILIHNYCIKRYIQICDKWNKLVKKSIK